MTTFSLAPMEGITDYRFRKIQAEIFGKADRYFTPFIAPTECHRFTMRDLRELSPEHNNGLFVIPQLIGKNAKDLLWAISELKEMGYPSVNLNIGCPSGTVVKKGKGAGLLSDLNYLDRLLSEIFDSSALPVSVKTRTGISDDSRFPEILELYNRYPLNEMIVHPRFQKQQYSGIPNIDCWDYAVQNSKMPLCYNGNIFYAEDAHRFSAVYKDFPIMLGRGMISNPGLIREIRSGTKANIVEMKEFHDRLYALCRLEINFERAVLLHMKELWYYFSCSFDGVEKPLKAVRKSDSYAEYEQAVSLLFSTCALREPAGFYVRG